MGIETRRCPVCDALVDEPEYAKHQTGHGPYTYESHVGGDRGAREPRGTTTLSPADREERRRSESDAEELARNTARRAATQRAMPILPELNLVVGERVRSSLSGEGVVTEIAESGPVQRVWVQFDSGRRGKLFARALERI